jgi:hypothetical protein
MIFLQARENNVSRGSVEVAGDRPDGEEIPRLIGYRPRVSFSHNLFTTERDVSRGSVEVAGDRPDGEEIPRLIGYRPRVSFSHDFFCRREREQCQLRVDRSGWRPA